VAKRGERRTTRPDEPSESRPQAYRKGPPRAYIEDRYEAGRFAGREGAVFGWTVPSWSREGPVIGARKGRDDDFALSVFFEDTEEQEWFSPHLVTIIEPGEL
jgi:hypothetical protein